MLTEFEENQRKSMFVHQYKCCGHSWWGTNQNNTCNRCKNIVSQLPLDKMIGIGWFECPCGRVYAGFSRGNVTSKCHGCEKENLPSFIVPGDEAGKKQGAKNTHYCAACRGRDHCPIVEQARGHKSSHSRRF